MLFFAGGQINFGETEVRIWKSKTKIPSKSRGLSMMYTINYECVSFQENDTYSDITCIMALKPFHIIIPPARKI